MRSLFLPLLSVLLLTGCGLAESLKPGNQETDRVARVVSDAIAWPRQDSAMGYARAAAATTAGQDGRLTVIEVTELEADEPTDPFGELKFLVHLDGSTSGLIKTDPVTACYRVTFGFYGVADSPRRADCPENPAAVDISAAPSAGPRIEIPKALTSGSVQSFAGCRPHCRRRSSRPICSGVPVDADAQQPAVAAAVDGTEVGVSIRGDDDGLLGLPNSRKSRGSESQRHSATARRAVLRSWDRPGGKRAERAALNAA